MIALKEQVPTMQTVANSGSIQLRGSSAEFVTNFYKWFNEESFVNSINEKIKNLKQGEKFNTDLVDLNQAPVYFILDKEFKNKEGNICKIINYDKKVVLEQSSKAYFISLAVCKEVDRWKLLAITLN